MAVFAGNQGTWRRDGETLVEGIFCQRMVQISGDSGSKSSIRIGWVRGQDLQVNVIKQFNGPPGDPLSCMEDLVRPSNEDGSRHPHYMCEIRYARASQLHQTRGMPCAHIDTRSTATGHTIAHNLPGDDSNLSEPFHSYHVEGTSDSAIS